MPHSDDPTLHLLTLQKHSLQKISMATPHPEELADVVTEEELLLAAQPSALFLLDDAGRIRRVAGAWEDVTGMHPEDAPGTPMASLLRLPNTRYPEGLLTHEGSCDDAVLRTQTGPRRVRVVWNRQGRFVAGHLERLDLSARSTYEADVREQQLTRELDEAVYCLGMSLDSWQSSHVERMWVSPPGWPRRLPSRPSRSRQCAGERPCTMWASRASRPRSSGKTGP